jgi:acyl-coenzyme A synthetase/AMP-(fatty) acid ligase
MSAIPLVPRIASDAFARQGNKQISVAQFCADIQALAQTLPAGEFLINLCQDRYTFTVSFFAALANHQTNLLPAKRDVADARTLAERFGACPIISDLGGDDADACVAIEPGGHGEATSPSCNPDHVAAIAFTSGSTGEPQAHPKSWRMLDTWRHVHQRYLPVDPNVPAGLVATVPSWHMYGLEWAMLLPTIAPLTLHCGADFYPQDVVRAVSGFSQPTVLVSTPVHLRALRQVPTPPTNVATILCATAPLDANLTTQIEAHFDARIFEIYGCSEIGSLASRFPAKNSNWEFFDCFDIAYNDGAVAVSHRELPAPITLADQFNCLDHDDGPQYELIGRTSDIIKIGGKRESLANLTHLLMDVDGVDDAVIYEPAALDLPDTGRLGALVVAPGMNSRAIRTALAQRMDAAFVPRPIRLIQALPRDRTSKLKRGELRKLLAKIERSDHD